MRQQWHVYQLLKEVLENSILGQRLVVVIPEQRLVKCHGSGITEATYDWV